MIKKYCEGLDCMICDEKEPCIYKIANKLAEKLQAKEQECEKLKKQVNKQKNVKVQLSKLSDRQLKEFCDMKQALDEIEKIVNVNINYYQDSWGTLAVKINSIKNIINKAKKNK